MKSLVCLYHEGNDTKVAVVTSENERLKIVRLSDYDVFQPHAAEVETISALNLDGGGLGDVSISTATPGQGFGGGISHESLLHSALTGIKLNNSEFLQAVTEPAIHYHIFEGNKNLPVNELKQAIIDDIQKTKNLSISKDNLSYTETTGNSLLTVFADGELNCINIINGLAQYHNKRYYKIAAVKSAEISLAYYIAKRKKFFPEDYSLIVYVGKEYSKLIFLQGKKLKHIGATLDIGTANLHTYDVYFSKILLEMENGGIPRLDNVVLCGEDESENLILSFYGTFPEANVSKLEFDNIDTSEVDDVYKGKLSSFSVPIAIAQEYFDELNKVHTGINLLPKYVKDEQKFFQFAWHSFAVLGLIFLVTFYFTKVVLDNGKEIREADQRIKELTLLQQQNQLVLDEIAQYEGKVNNFGATQAILDEATKGTEVWTNMLQDMSSFMGVRENMWLTSLSIGDGGKAEANGYGLSRSVLTAFADSYQSSILNSIMQEKLREANSFKFKLNFDVTNLTDKKNEPKN